MNETQRKQVQEALGWSSCIECCSDKERFAHRVWDLIFKLGIDVNDVPENVVNALENLMNWEACAEPCDTVNIYLESLLIIDDNILEYHRS